MQNISDNKITYDIKHTYFLLVWLHFDKFYKFIYWIILTILVEIYNFKFYLYYGYYNEKILYYNIMFIT